MTNEFGKGPLLEYIVSGLFQNQGYLTRRSIPLIYGNNNATDVDILGITFTPPYQMHKIICDCKNKQKSKPYERIFWAKGLGQFVDATDVYVSLPQASWDIVKFAQNGEVRILTADLIQEYYEHNHNLYGIADDKFYKDFFISLNKEIKTDHILGAYYNKLRTLYLNEDPYVAINIILEIMYSSGKQLSLAKNNDLIQKYTFWKYICCEALVLLSLNILKICADTICLPTKARKEHILSKLTYGDIDPQKITTILGYAKDVANEMIKTSIPRSALPNTEIVDFGEITPPSYAQNIIGLVERALQNQDWYINLPQVLDFILFEFALKNQEFSMDTFKKVFNSGYAEEELKAAKNILFFARNTCNVDLKLLWDNSDSFIAKNTDKRANNINSDIAGANKKIDQLNMYDYLDNKKNLKE